MSEEPKYICGMGSATAKIMIVSDFPDIKDIKEPFSGPAGIILNELLEAAGTKRSECYLTNILKYRPPLGLIEKYHLSVEDALSAFYQEVESLKPNVIVAFGELPLKLLLGRKKITQQRGSILQDLKTGIKIIPSIHPRELFNYKKSEDEDEEEKGSNPYSDRLIIQWDINRAVEESKFKDFRAEHRNLRVCKSAYDADQFFYQYRNKNICAVDIETYHTVPSCISFAFTKYDGMSFPLLKMMSPELSRTDMISVWRLVAKCLADTNIRKIGQNFGFDSTQLEKPVDGTLNFGMKVLGFYYDTMLANKCLFPELPAKLQFLTSIYTRQQYYKDEGKFYDPKRDKPDKLLRYNCMDSLVTFEIYEKQMTLFESKPSLKEFFFTRFMPLHSFYLRMQNRGILRNEVVQNELETKYLFKENDILAQLRDDLSSFSIELKKGDKSGGINLNSNPQMMKLLYETLEIPQRVKADEKTIDALCRNVVKDPVKLRVLSSILELRKVRKTLKTYINAIPAFDGRVRSGYRLTLETGRTSTSILKPPIVTVKQGCAFQTVTKHGDVGTDIRAMYIPTPGYVFIEPDQSQAEARVIAILGKDLKLQKMFKYGLDIHRITTNMIFNLWHGLELIYFFQENDDARLKQLAKIINKTLKDKIDEETRQVGKKGRHAANLGIGKAEAASQLGIKESEAAKILDKIHDTNPQIRQGFHKGIEQWLQTHNRTLCNPFGRERQFLAKWGRELFKEAYAQLPQSTVSDQTKFAMRRTEQRIGANNIRFLMESHDSYLAELPIKQAIDKNLRICIEELETPINFGKCSLIEDSSIELTIPCEMKCGMNWRDTKVITI